VARVLFRGRNLKELEHRGKKAKQAKKAKKALSVFIYFSSAG
jgi:hypothetical protein